MTAPKMRVSILSRPFLFFGIEKEELQKLVVNLSKIGFDKVQRDPLYDKFIQAVYKNPELKNIPIDKEERAIQNEKMAQLIKQLMEEEKKE